MKRGQGLPITVIIVAALGILVLVVIGAIFGGQIFKFGRTASTCPGTCVVVDKGLRPLAAQSYMEDRSANKGLCYSDFETELSGNYVAQNMPKNGKIEDWKCVRCCVATG